jgi:hypothetical protein
MALKRAANYKKFFFKSCVFVVCVGQGFCGECPKPSGDEKVGSFPADEAAVE